MQAHPDLPAEKVNQILSNADEARLVFQATPRDAREREKTCTAQQTIFERGDVSQTAVSALIGVYPPDRLVDELYIEAVKVFQEELGGIKVDGVFGPITAKRAQEVAKSQPGRFNVDHHALIAELTPGENKAA